MMHERLGVDPVHDAPVWVTWFDPADLTAGFAVAIARLAGECHCLECAAPIDLLRRGGVLQAISEASGPVVSASDRCGACQAQLHFDATPAAWRARLQWPAVAVGAPLTMSPAVAAAFGLPGETH